MNHRTLCALMITMGLGFAPRSSEAMEPAARKADPSCNASEMLKGMVHLGDDDVRFKTKEGVVVFVDPIADPTAGQAVACGLVKPDLILITHPHDDHFQPGVIQAYLKLNPKAVLAGPGEVAKLAMDKGIQMQSVTPGQNYQMAGVGFETFPAFFAEGDSHPKGNQWVGYVLNLDGVRYYVTGDTQPLPEMASLDADVILPLLSGCGGNMDEALKMISISQAKIVVPVHHSDQVETIKRCIASLPKGIQSAYFLKGKLIQIP